MRKASRALETRAHENHAQHTDQAAKLSSIIEESDSKLLVSQAERPNFRYGWKHDVAFPPRPVTDRPMKTEWMRLMQALAACGVSLVGACATTATSRPVLVDLRYRGERVTMSQLEQVLATRQVRSCDVAMMPTKRAGNADGNAVMQLMDAHGFQVGLVNAGPEGAGALEPGGFPCGGMAFIRAAQFAQ